MRKLSCETCRAFVFMTAAHTIGDSAHLVLKAFVSIFTGGNDEIPPTPH